jgi:hypothetical protein
MGSSHEPGLGLADSCALMIASYASASKRNVVARSLGQRRLGMRQQAPANVDGPRTPSRDV